MAREADRIVAEIRASRARLGNELGELVPGRGLVHRMQARPVAWIAGGLFAGLLVGRLWGKPLLQAGKDYASNRLRDRARGAVATLVAASLSRVTNRDNGAPTGGGL